MIKLHPMSEPATPLNSDSSDSAVFQDRSLELRDKRRQFFGKLVSLGRAWRSGGMRAVYAKFARLAGVWREGGLAALRARIFADSSSRNYSRWVRLYDTISAEDRKAISIAVEALPVKPLISVLMPVYNTPARWLRAAIDSVRAQLYDNWELCIADDASSAPHVRSILEEYASKDKRIKVIFRPERGEIAAATNLALSKSSGQYVAFLDHDDELSEHALFLVARELNQSPGLRMLYSDEDKIDEAGQRLDPHFKSGWNPLLLLQQNYVCHLLVLESELLKEISGLSSGYEGAQDWDLILRASERIKPQQIARIPYILYHWRIHEGSTAKSISYKPKAPLSQQRAVQAHLARRGLPSAQVAIRSDISTLQIKLKKPDPEPLVSIIIPNKDKVELLSQCINSIISKSTYKNLEFIIVDNDSQESRTESYYLKLASDLRFKVLRDKQPFNFSRLINLGVKNAKGNILALLNNDLQVITPDWLAEMVSWALLPEVGAVGARLLYPDDSVQHAGVILGIGGVAGHSHKNLGRWDYGFFLRPLLVQNLSAVTGACLVCRKQVFAEVSGFDQENLQIALNDVDFCLKLRAQGYQIVYTPAAELYHHESASRGYEDSTEKSRRFEKERQFMLTRWGQVLANDPYYNPNLSNQIEDFSLAFPPRAPRFWKEN